MHVFASIFIIWKNITQPQPRLPAPNGFEVDTKGRVANQAVVSGIVLFNCVSPLNSKTGIYCCTPGKGSCWCWIV